MIGERRQTLGGCTTRVLEAGEGEPALILVHGFGDSADTWRPLMRALTARGRRSVALDLPGFAEAARLRPGPILPQLDAAVAELAGHAAIGPNGPFGRRRRGRERPIMVGNSLGGQVALRLARIPSPPVAAVAALAPAGVWTPGWAAIVERDPIVRLLLRMPLPAPSPAVRYAVGRILGRLAFNRPERIDPSQVASFTRHYRSLDDVRRLHQTLQRILPELRPPMEVDGIAVPVLLVWGDCDRLITRRGFDRVLAAAPAGELVVFDGCGHCPQLEQTSRLADLLCNPPLDLTGGQRRLIGLP